MTARLCLFICVTLMTYSSVNKISNQSLPQIHFVLRLFFYIFTSLFKYYIFMAHWYLSNFMKLLLLLSCVLSLWLVLIELTLDIWRLQCPSLRWPAGRSACCRFTVSCNPDDSVVYLNWHVSVQFFHCRRIHLTTSCMLHFCLISVLDF